MGWLFGCPQGGEHVWRTVETGNAGYTVFRCRKCGKRKTYDEIPEVR